MRLFHGAATLLLASAVVACSFLPWASLHPEEPDASTDASSGADADAEASIPDAADAADASNGNLVSDPGFEGATVGCAGWGGFAGAVVSVVNDGHDSKKSCQICVSGSGNSGFYQEFPVSGATGMVVQWSGWIKAPADASAAQIPDIQIDQLDKAGDGGTESSYVNNVPVTSSWAPFTQTSSVATHAFTHVGTNITLHSPNGSSACILVDDFVVIVGK